MRLTACFVSAGHKPIAFRGCERSVLCGALFGWLFALPREAPFR